MKKQFITRVFLSSLVLALTSLFGGGNLLAQTTVFYESFDDCAGEGGNDGKWNNLSQDVTLTTVNEGWTFVKGNGASKCARFGSSGSLGSATTPALGFEGGATLTFKAGAWNASKEKTTLKISIAAGNGSLSQTSVEMTKGKWQNYTITITGASTDTKIKFVGLQSSNSRFFLDEVKITQASTSDPGDTRTDPKLAYGVSEYNATIGQENTFPVLTYAVGVTGITYSSSDPNVATVEADGNVTLKGIEGTTTITASISGSQTWKDAQASYTLNVSKRSAELAYNPSSCTVIVGETPELPTLEHADGVTGFVYASSNTEVATVNETTGEVTLTGAVGTTVISATFEGNATFANGTASYTLTVTKSMTYRYKKVTATEDLMDGGQYIIVCEEMNVAKNTSDTGAIDVTITDGMIAPPASAEFGVLTLEACADGFYLKIADDKYLKASNSSGLNSTSSTGVAWTITIDESGNAFMHCSANTDNRQILFQDYSVGGTKQYYFRNYASSSIGVKGYYNIQLYQKVYPLTVSSATGGYATFYNEEEAYQMPKRLKGYAVSKAEAGDCITRTTAYEAGATVPAKTPLLIIGEANSYYPAVVSGTGVDAYPGENLLEGTRDANGFAKSANENVYYYKLGLNAEKLGFYWGAADGAAFQMKKATTAYLAIPQTMANGANALFFDFGGETGINEIQTEQANKAIFDLSGRRVKKATKGFYIVGGKKVLVK